MNIKNNYISQKNNKWYLKKINFFLTQKYELIFKNKDILFFNKIHISIRLIFLSDEDILLKNILLILEIITGQKAVAMGLFRYLGSTKKFFFNAKIYVRKKINSFYFIF